ncbi:hypothetical protein Tco_0450495 [Tanacetum coccineum]
MPKSAWTEKDLIDNFLKERRFYTSAGNPVKEILLKLNLPDHRKLKDGGEDIWDRVKLLMQGIEFSYQERECKLYNEFNKFTSIKGESLHEYYLRFAQLINDMHTIGMTMQ